MHDGARMDDPADDPFAGIAVADETMPADRVFLSGHVLDVEIGAYAEEEGVTQRVRFDIVLEVRPNPDPLADDVAGVINYDRLVEAIAAVAAGPRIRLLETFAERLAGRLLADPKARRVSIRIEKLDRLEAGATLGCRIVRRRAEGA